MIILNLNLAKIKLYHIGFFVLLSISITLRFINLSYSELQDDEKKTQIRPLPQESTMDFFLRQRKGPMQFLVAYVPHSIFDPKIEVNEFAIRFPFTLANLISVFALYGLVFKLTRNHGVSFFTSATYSISGFVVGFSRIAQYQNLNLLFSLLSLYFYADLKYRDRHLLRSSFFGTVFLSLSVLSHWDAFFYIVPTVYFFSSFIKRREVFRKEGKACLIAVFTTFSVLVIPFLVLYTTSMQSNQSGNINYLFKRVGVEGSLLTRHRYIFELYNPEIALWLYIAGILLAIFFIDKTWIFFVWFGFDLFLIKFFMVTPKTHIYNYVIPAIILSSLGCYYFYLIFSHKFKPLRFILSVAAFAAIAILTVQSYQIFVDHESEYPFDKKKILWHQNNAFIDEEILTFGFPHNRNWKTIDKYIDTNCRYITNESKGISQIYVKALYGREEGCYYVVVIKRPFYTKTQDAVYAGVKDSKMVYKYVKNGETLAKVYRMK